MNQCTDRPEILARGKKAYVGIDVHKGSWFTTVLVEDEVVFRARIDPVYSHLRGVFDRLPDCQVMVAYEAGSCGFQLYDELENDHVSCVVAAPSMTPVQTGDRVKVDRKDSLKLAQLLACGLLTPVFVLSPEARSHRDLLRTRHQLLLHRGDAKRQIKAKLLFHGVEGPTVSRGVWTSLYVKALRSMEFPSMTLRVGVLALLDLVEHLSSQLKTLDEEIARLAESDAYWAKVRLLKSVPGIGLLTAMVILTELGDMSRFTSNEKFASFLGLTPAEYSSGDSIRKGRITRCGNERVRRALVESSWSLIKYDPALRRKYKTLAKRKGSKRAIVAIARILSGRIRHILIHNEIYKKTA